MEMREIRLPQPVGLKTEMAKALGRTAEELIDIVKTKNWAALPSLPEGRGTWEGWIDFAANQTDMLLAALKEGYRFNFATIGGVRTLLEVKWGLILSKDYQDGGESAENVPLTDEAVQELGRLVTVPWEITPTGQKGSSPSGRPLYRIAHRI
ncbi:hypothetical protein GCM10010917_30040 [Paenibacillus physcomitrellae]|uniref:Uncharacterized protein n=2 Tax=Paenibacillus physcomitrellae TaxID=1619311 RepID=A0ABQ1GFG9_9BACL|nr:hypothetical protein GCM10010917_30040 [Paenibacillus physcomitrellae]